MRSATPPLRVRDGGQHQIVSQVWKRATDDAGVVPEKEATNAAEDRECPHLPCCVVSASASAWSAAAMCFRGHSHLLNVPINAKHMLQSICTKVRRDDDLSQR